LKTLVDNLVVNPSGLVMDFRTIFWSTKKVSHEPLGSMGRAHCMKHIEEEYVHHADSRIGLAVHDDFLNEALFSAWRGGLFNMSLGPDDIGDSGELTALGVSDLSVTTDFFLPPVLNDCEPDGQMRVYIGDVYIVAEMNMLGAPLEFALFGQIVATAELGLSEQDGVSELGIEFTDIEFFEIEVVSATGDLSFDLLETILKDQLVASLVDQLVGDSLGSFELPEIDLSSLGDGFPDGLKIGILPLSLERNVGFTVIDGTIQ